MIVHPATAIFPGKTFEYALDRIVKGVEEPLWGNLNPSIVELCPQNAGPMTLDRLSNLILLYPNVEFRLHASLRVGEDRSNISATRVEGKERIIESIGELCKLAGNTPYIIHAGNREEGDMQTIIENLSIVRKIFNNVGCTSIVGVEPLYPFKNGSLLLDSWREWESLLENSIPYALDLSHANIVARKEGRAEQLLTQMISSDLCVEVHVSGNDGIADTHSILSSPPWWHELLVKNVGAKPIITEGVQIDLNSKRFNRN